MDIISYETIRAAHRAEKEDSLQKLPNNFLNAVKNWFELKKDKKDTTSLLEIENAKKLIDDLISKRERKIVLSALRTVRGELPPSNLSDNELRFFDQIVLILKDYRQNIKEITMSYDTIVEEKIEDVKKAIEEIHRAEEINDTIEPPKFDIPAGKKMLKIVLEMNKFVGSDMKNYGPFKIGDVAVLPESIANILMSRKAAENMVE